MRKKSGGAVIKIHNKETNEFLGRISEADLQFLADNLEEESIRDSDYYVLRETVDQFAQKGASPRLMEVLRGGLRNGNAIEIRWEKDNASSGA
jgi:hypothetical protein